MERRSLEGVYGPDLEIDLCFPCHVLWLDKRESIHLSPRGTLDLFRLLAEHGEDPRHSLGDAVGCPRCRARLRLTRDIGKAGRFSYLACPKRHGRLTPFSEFLKEKQFVRTLDPMEQRQLRAEVKQVQCSGCGAPVDLGSGFACAHCGSPVTVLDANAVEDTLRRLQDAQARRSSADADAEARAAKARALASVEAERSKPDEYFSQFTANRRSSNLGLDILTASLGALFRPR
jgi:hypothetical protein